MISRIGARGCAPAVSIRPKVSAAAASAARSVLILVVLRGRGATPAVSYQKRRSAGGGAGPVSDTFSRNEKAVSDTFFPREGVGHRCAREKRCLTPGRRGEHARRRGSTFRRRLSAAALGRRSRVVDARREAAALEQRLDARLVTRELAEQVERLGASAARQQQRAEAVAVLAREPAVLPEPLDGVRIEHLRPDVRVVRGSIAAEDVAEVRRAIAR